MGLLFEAAKITPVVYCQHTTTNQVLCSLLSSILLRDIGSLRFDRDQQRELTKRKIASSAGSVLTKYVPDRALRSNTIFVIAVCDNMLDDDLLTEAILRRATNRGHTVVVLKMKRMALLWEEIRLQDEFPNQEIFLLSSRYHEWCHHLIESAFRLNGMLIIHDESQGDPAISSSLLYSTSIRTIVVSTKPDALLKGVQYNPHILVVALDGTEIKFARSKEDWLSQLFVEFGEAENKRKHFKEIYGAPLARL